MLLLSLLISLLAVVVDGCCCCRCCCLLLALVAKKLTVRRRLVRASHITTVTDRDRRRSPLYRNSHQDTCTKVHKRNPLFPFRISCFSQMRLAREAFSVPVHTASASTLPAEQTSSGGGGGRGRADSPAPGGDAGADERRRQRYPESRSPMSRSTPSSPGLDDRPHRRTRRGGRRGRNR